VAHLYGHRLKCRSFLENHVSCIEVVHIKPLYMKIKLDPYVTLTLAPTTQVLHTRLPTTEVSLSLNRTPFLATL
jgi:hypothetical protein